MAEETFRYIRREFPNKEGELVVLEDLAWQLFFDESAAAQREMQKARVKFNDRLKKIRLVDNTLIVELSREDSSEYYLLSDNLPAKYKRKVAKKQTYFVKDDRMV